MSYLGQEIKQVYPTSVAMGGANMGQVPLFSVQWWANRAAIPAGYVAADGQELPKFLYPDADAGIQANNVPLTTEATWQGDPTERGKFVATSSAGKFRVPDYNGKSAGSLGAVFLRGDGALSAGQTGVIQLSAMKEHTHDTTTGTTAPFGTSSSTVRGTIVEGSNPTVTTAPATGGVTGGAATETRPLNVTGCFIIKLFGAVTNAGAADAAQLATEFASHAAVLQKAFTRDNLIGVVSQIGGAPTGAVIESGGNANGMYTKFADGTMICIIGLGIDNGGWFSIDATASTPAIKTWIYPAEFTRRPALSPFIANVSNSLAYTISKLTSNVVQNDHAEIHLQASATQQYRLSITAIGRWF